MDRRSVLKTVSILVGGAMSGGTIATIMSGCQPNTSDGYQPFILSNTQLEMLAEVVETILPTTDTPGAKELMIHRAMDEALAKNFEKDDQDTIIGSLKSIDGECDKLHQKTFMQASAEERLATIEALDKASYDMMSTQTNIRYEGYAKKHFFYELKGLTLGCYFLTEVGQTQVLQHVAIPGKYESCINLSEAGNGKTWAQD